MNKRILTLFMCFLLLLTTGCSSSGTADTSKSNNNTNDSSDNEASLNASDADSDSTETDDNAAPVEGTNTEKANLSLYSVIPSQGTSRITAEDGTILLYSDYQSLRLEGAEYPALSEKFNAWNEKRITDLHQSHLDYAKIAQEEALLLDDFYGYSTSLEYNIKRLDSHILSLTEFYSEYMGGAHPSSYYDGINFDVTTGEILSLADITNDYSSFSDAAIAYILDYLKNNTPADISYFDDYETVVSESFSDTPWYFSAAGITMIYNTYMIAPYAAGTFEITLPLSTFESYIKDTYLIKNEPGITFIPFDGKNTVTVHTASGSHSLTITDGYYIDGPEVYEDVPPVITLNDSSITTENFFLYLMNCYLIQQKDRTLLMLDGDMASSDYNTVLYDITDGTLKEVASTFASIFMPGLNTVELSVRVDTLGTYFARTTFDITAGNEFHMLSSAYGIGTPYTPLKTIRELPVTTADGEELLLPVGTLLTPCSTDAQSYVTVSGEGDSEAYTIHFTKEDGIIYIDGKKEYEYFEMLPYAG